jgi:hypothetical protein
VTLETVDADSGGRMAALAKLTGGVYGHKLPVSILFRMTTDAFRQTVLFGAYALMDGAVSLVHEHLHVISTHKFRGLDTLFEPIRPAAAGSRGIHGPGRTGHANAQAQNQ